MMKKLLFMAMVMALPTMSRAEDIIQVVPSNTTAGVTEADEQYLSVNMANTSADIANLQEEDTAAEVALIEERSRKLDCMMSQLPEVQRQAVQMRYIDQLSHEEMQQRLGMSSSNVYTTLSRAMSALKTMIHGR